ncbi:MAG: Gx transporter family protein [Spirochaetales bacterium]|nr:Gx transporter family protein [Spirochaetales bacterium]
MLSASEPGRAGRPVRAGRASRPGRASRTLSERGRVVVLAAAVCLFLATIEHIIPRPLPFLRIGLANLPLLVTLDLLPAGSFFLLVALKILGQSLIQGSLFSYLFLFSLSGSLASALLMWAARRALGPRISLVGVSILGALASNVTQLSLARALVFGPSAWMIAPPLLLVGLVASILLGVLAEIYRRRSTFLRAVAGRLGREDRLPPLTGT